MKHTLVAGAALAAGLSLVGCREEQVETKRSGESPVSLPVQAAPHQQAASMNVWQPKQAEPTAKLEYEDRTVEILALADVVKGQVRAWKPDGSLAPELKPLIMKGINEGGGLESLKHPSWGAPEGHRRLLLAVRSTGSLAPSLSFDSSGGNQRGYGHIDSSPRMDQDAGPVISFYNLDYPVGKNSADILITDSFPGKGEFVSLKLTPGQEAGGIRVVDTHVVELEKARRGGLTHRVHVLFSAESATGPVYIEQPGERGGSYVFATDSFDNAVELMNAYDPKARDFELDGAAGLANPLYAYKLAKEEAPVVEVRLRPVIRHLYKGVPLQPKS